jgi:3-oxoacyl-[acyl-carrier protein] reductase
LVTYFRLSIGIDSRIPDAYRANRASDAEAVVAAIVAFGGTAIAMEADLADAGNVPRLFDHAERELGPVDILVNGT